MALVLDTVELDARDRIEAVNAAIAITEVPHVVVHAGVIGEVRHRLDVSSLGPLCQVAELGGTAMRLLRGPRQLRLAAPERIALGIQLRQPGGRTHLGLQETFAVGDLVVTDLTSSHAYTWVDGGACRSCEFEYGVLGLPVDLVRRAIPTLRRSPLYPLVQGHLGELGRGAERVSAGPAAAMLATATMELLRALVVTAVDEDPARQRQVLDTTLLSRIKHHLERHLTDPTMTVASVAAAHHISVRRVYQVWAGSELSLSQWIIHARLEGARAELARPGPTPLAVSRVARRWGFSDTAHFSRRFRSAYGISPREWRLLSAQAHLS